MPGNATDHKGVIADSAMVVSANPIATQVGIDILKQGGNAVDAAIAVDFALAVVYPDAGNLGGGGFMLLRMHNGESDALDFRETAPQAATRDMFLDAKTGGVDRERIEHTGLASGVPGSVDGMWTAHTKYGSLSWSALLQPAIDLAFRGFPISERQAAELNALRPDLEKYNPGSSYFRNDGGDWKAGDTLAQFDLANTLLAIRDYGREGFYEGGIAFLIEREMRMQNGLITRTDLSDYHSVWRKPLVGSYRGFTVLSMPPPSSGGVALLQMLNMTEPYPLGSYGQHSAQAMHLMAEAEKRAYADRAYWLGDPDYVKIPVQELISKAYASTRMKDYAAATATPASGIQAGSIAGYESEETTHFSIVDAMGNAVAVTTTLNDSYGSHITVSGAGFLLNNEMDDFSAKPGTPNMYGLIGGKANAIAPGKRMLSSMTPSIVLKDSSLFLVTGTPGGSTIITTVFQNITDVVDFGLDLQASVDASRFYDQWQPDVLYVEEGGFRQATLDSLGAMGYNVNTRKPMGRVDAVEVLPGGKLEGAADPRGNDKATGY